MSEQEIFFPNKGFSRGIVVYDNGLYDGVDLKECITNWEIELTKAIPKAYLITDCESAFLMTDSIRYSQSNIKFSPIGKPSPIELLRLIKAMTDRKLSISSVYSMKFSELFNELYY